jgi:alpha,alpha-trehalase
MEELLLKAAILDLDGVITQTATLHAEAWKKMFDQYNEQRKEKKQEPYEEFSIEKDYPVYIDGMPRYRGVNTFLKSRNIEMPWGDPTDEPGKETVCGLGNLKNELFLSKLDNQGAQIIEPNVKMVRKWRKAGLKTAIVSSSKNCKRILKSVNLESLFDVRVDGIIAVERNLKGKPYPDTFLEAVEELGFKPEEALVVEDALAGVEAGVGGHFKLVIGIGEGDAVPQMKEMGADTVVKPLDDLSINIGSELRNHKELPDAIENFDQLAEEWQNRKIFLFLDYDGTLSPIVEEFDKAFLAPEMRQTIDKVANVCRTAIISGRGREDVKNRVELEDLYYAGSHGFEISGPDQFYYEVERAKKLIPALDNIEKDLRDNLNTIEGVKFERKKFAMAVHYRQAAEDQEENVKKIVDQVVRNYDKITQGRGKKVIEIKPNVYWNKGKAINHLLKVLNKKKEPAFVIYIGDDITDEDAYMQIRQGAGILVGDHGEPTFARYHLKDVDAVQVFLTKMRSNLE